MRLLFEGVRSMYGAPLWITALKLIIYMQWVTCFRAHIIAMSVSRFGVNVSHGSLIEYCGNVMRRNVNSFRYQSMHWSEWLKRVLERFYIIFAISFSLSLSISQYLFTYSVGVEPLTCLYTIFLLYYRYYCRVHVAIH